MAVARWSTPSAELTQRLAFRLRAGAPSNARSALWQRDGQLLLVHLTTLRVSVKDGWLLADLFVETEPTGRRLLQFVFFLGSDGEGDGSQAGATIHTDSREAAQLAQLWGSELQRVLWDGVLDVLEGCLALAERRLPGRSLNILGFSCGSDQLHVDIEAEGGA
ncbi:MAG: hypothetical protein GC160_01475 [Acidobacteria bacterium]|nr:hypothetical protein [Acidobacteriota bacterium]